jgi:hypothetical protein
VGAASDDDSTVDPQVCATTAAWLNRLDLYVTRVYQSLDTHARRLPVDPTAAHECRQILRDADGKLKAIDAFSHVDRAVFSHVDRAVFGQVDRAATAAEARAAATLLPRGASTHLSTTSVSTSTSMNGHLTGASRGGVNGSMNGGVNGSVNGGMSGESVLCARGGSGGVNGKGSVPRRQLVPSSRQSYTRYWSSKVCV